MPLYELSSDLIAEIPTVTYASLGLREREDVQRVLREHIGVISPDTLILAEEFGEWIDSRRRIDLLGLNRDGSLVVIELKRTEDGGHMELQALRYAAMVSTLTFEQAVDAHQGFRKSRGLLPDSAESIIREFLDIAEGPVAFSNKVRIILASANFSKEITSTVLWLNAQGLDVVCVKMRPHSFQGRVLLDIEQVIPLPEAAAFQVAIREKSLAQQAVETNGRDLTRYRLQTSQGETFSNLPKRRLIYKVVAEAIKLGVKPKEILCAIPWRQANMFISAPGKLSGAALMATASTRSAIRYFCADNELFYIDNCTYSMINQWGPSTEEAVKKILEILPANHGLQYESEV
ncbi:hypothetical protein [Janthinobacterium psychrotolerans]|uniref:Endonuclease NucS n=1 Tax=Janthinobacterium psychrotolerans TaxID=1747903 RepID=A0A1A7C7G3_9BURK|nr:hypothetical protein [Janthinobacterium psychrotolerans]OBV41657.1 hypothetical protein ASR47_10413 [Janthinobacterium psychrotolerans]